MAAALGDRLGHRLPRLRPHGGDQRGEVEAVRRRDRVGREVGRQQVLGVAQDLRRRVDLQRLRGQAREVPGVGPVAGVDGRVLAVEQHLVPARGGGAHGAELDAGEPGGVGVEHALDRQRREVALARQARVGGEQVAVVDGEPAGEQLGHHAQRGVEARLEAGDGVGGDQVVRHGA